MTASKSILTVSTLAFALMFGGGVYILMHLNTLAKPIAERIASDALGVSVTIDNIEVSLKNKRVGVYGIDVANPPGYSKPHAVEIEKANIVLNTASETLIDFKDIFVDGTQVFVEVKEGGTNLHTIRKGIKGADQPGSGETPLKVIIQRFILNGAQINPSVTLISEQDLEPITFEPVMLNGIGQRENGILAREAVAQIMEPLLQAFTVEAGDAGFYKGLSPEALKELGVSNFDQLKTQIKDDIDKIGDSVKQLFD